MMRLDRILRDYAEAGAVNAQIALWGFVDDHTFLTKAGHVGLVYRIRGTDAEGLTHDQRRVLVHQMEAALRLLDDRCRVYQYVLKQEAVSFVAAPCSRPVAQEAVARRADFLNSRRAGLFTVDHFLVLIYEPPVARSTRSVSDALREPREALRNWLSHGRRCRMVEADLDRAIESLHHRAKGLESHSTETTERPRADAISWAEKPAIFHRQTIRSSGDSLARTSRRRISRSICSGEPNCACATAMCSWLASGAKVLLNEPRRGAPHVGRRDAAHRHPGVAVDALDGATACLTTGDAASCLLHDLGDGHVVLQVGKPSSKLWQQSSQHTLDAVTERFPVAVQQPERAHVIHDTSRPGARGRGAAISRPVATV